MTTAEDRAVHAALWGQQDVLLDEIEAGHLVAQQFVHPERRAVIEAVLAIAELGFDPSPVTVLQRLVDAEGWRWTDAHHAVVLPGQFTPWQGQLWRLPEYIGAVAEEHRLREVNALLTRLAARAARPGGATRVAEELGMAL